MRKCMNSCSEHTWKASVLAHGPGTFSTAVTSARRGQCQRHVVVKLKVMQSYGQPGTTGSFEPIYPF